MIKEIDRAIVDLGEKMDSYKGFVKLVKNGYKPDGFYLTEKIIIRYAGLEGLEKARADLKMYVTGYKDQINQIWSSGDTMLVSYSVTCRYKSYPIRLEIWIRFPVDEFPAEKYGKGECCKVKKHKETTTTYSLVCEVPA